jgi:hypothetical protein
MLATGDRRDCFVVVDPGGHHALDKKLTGLTLAEIRRRLADLDRAQLPDVGQAQRMQRHTLAARERQRASRELRCRCAARRHRWRGDAHAHRLSGCGYAAHVRKAADGPRRVGTARQCLNRPCQRPIGPSDRRAGANRLAAPADLGPQHRTQRRTLGVTSAITSKLRPHALRAGRLSHRQSRETSGPKPPNKLTETRYWEASSPTRRAMGLVRITDGRGETSRVG